MTIETGSEYVLGVSVLEQQRLLGQAAALQPEANWLLDQIGVEKGWRAADVGCGPIGVLDLLNDRVGVEGTVIGIERERRFAEMAQAVVAARGLANVKIICSGLESAPTTPETFDLVHERLVLHLQPDPEAFLTNMLKLARPGGWVAVGCVDSASLFSEPPHPAWARLWEALASVWRENMLDAYFGRRLPGLLKRAGLGDIGVGAHAQIAHPGDYRRDLLPALVTSFRPLIVQAGMMTGSEVDEHLAALTEHLANPETLVMGALHIQAWGRKPG
jgi:SAM-dependent methyltransferase